MSLDHAPEWGPSGVTVFNRTYSRVKPNGKKETWLETVERVVDGNLELVDPKHIGAGEREQLIDLIYNFKIMPAGRHLWASGAKGRQYLFNCWTAGWKSDFAEHFEFLFLRLMEGGGVGTNYSSRYTSGYQFLSGPYEVHIVCEPSHPDYDAMKEAGLLSNVYDANWSGAFQIEDSREGWAAGLVDFLGTYFKTDVKHKERVYDVSLVREHGARLKTFGGNASGPLPFAEMMVNIANVMNRSDKPSPLDLMEIDHYIACCVVSGGVRRSSRMAILDWDDPFIMQFLDCKQDGSKHWTTNISVAIDDEFIRQVRGDAYDSMAMRVYASIAEGMLLNGEPGIWNKSLAQTGELNEIYSTNPCGEICLEEWENCNLGHINMMKFAHEWDSPGREDELRFAHRLMTRFLIRATYGDVNDPKSRQVLDVNRRIGVGHFGVQGFFNLNGLRYEANDEYADLLESLYVTVRNEARRYSFQLRIPEPIKVTTVAPTGSIAKLSGSTEGIHPIYGRYYIRRIRFSKSDPGQVDAVEKFRDQGFKVYDDIYAADTYVVEFPTKDLLVQQVEDAGLRASRVVRSADELTLVEHLQLQTMYQVHWADNAVSYTANIPHGSIGPAYLMMELADYLDRLKGFTLMPENQREMAPYERITEVQYEEMTGPKIIEDSTDELCANGACPVR